MKRRIGRTAILMAAVMLCSVIMGMTAQAAVGGIVESFFTSNNGKTYCMPITKPVRPYENWIGFNATGGNVETTNKKAVAVETLYEYYNGARLDGFRMTPVGVGTSKITVTYKYTDQNNYSRSAVTSFTIRTYKWTNPFATLKIGKKNFRKAFKNTDEKTISPVKGRLNIRMNRKYKLRKVYYQASGTSTWKKIGKRAKVKLNHGDKLKFLIKDSKHYVKDATAIFTVG